MGEKKGFEDSSREFADFSPHLTLACGAGVGDPNFVQQKLLFEKSKMGADPAMSWGRFPLCPEMSHFVPVCPLLSRVVPVLGLRKDKRGQTRKKRDISGQIGKCPHVGSTPI